MNILKKIYTIFCDLLAFTGWLYILAIGFYSIRQKDFIINVKPTDKYYGYILIAIAVFMFIVFIYSLINRLSKKK